MMKLGILAGFMLFSVLPVFAQDNLDLRYTFKEGDHFQMQEHSQQDNYLTLDDVRERNTRQLDATIVFTVTSLQHMSAVIEGKIAEFTLLASGNNQQVSVSTKGDENDIYNKAFQKIVNKPFRFTLQFNGTIKSITGLDTLFDDIIQSLKLKHDDEKQAMRQLLEGQFGGEELKAKLVMVLPHYPTHAVHTGDSWLDVIYTDGFYHGRIDNYWALEYGDKHTIKLSNKGKFTTDENEVVDLGAGLKGTINLNGETKGQFLVDPETGWPTLCTQHTELNGSYLYKKNRKLKIKKDLEVPVRVVSDIRYQIKHL